MEIRPGETLKLRAGNFRAEKLLGKGKSGYSWLVTGGTSRLVLKAIHDEPCHYYTFGDKFAAEVHAFEKLSPLIQVPALIESDAEKRYLLKEYVLGPTAAELAAANALPEEAFAAMFAMCRKLYGAGINIDYFPTNFVWSGGELVYVDYEFNPYAEEWDFERWGIYYWLNSEGMEKFLSHGDHGAINIEGTGKPVSGPFEREAGRLAKKYGRQKHGKSP